MSGAVAGKTKGEDQATQEKKVDDHDDWVSCGLFANLWMIYGYLRHVAFATSYFDPDVVVKALDFSSLT